MFFKHGLGALAALVLTANPAQANEAAATTATTQITGAVATQSATGDREFGELFASWKSIDTTGGIVASRAADRRGCRFRPACRCTTPR
jgi:hypothetical protein